VLVTPEVFRRLCRARDLLGATDAPALAVRDVARAVRISPYHFIRQFDAVFGATPHQLRIQARLERARQLLALGRHSVTEVCFEVGFHSLGSFSALFTRRIGAGIAAGDGVPRLPEPARAPAERRAAPVATVRNFQEARAARGWQGGRAVTRGRQCESS
jgi:AraC-like DNA-binding protein